MGDDERRPALHQRFERALHQSFAFGVEGRGRLVQKQHRRVFQDRAGDGEALALAARQRDAALAELRIVALRQGGDEAVRGRLPGGGDDRLARRVGRAIGDVVGDARPEDERVLRHKRDLGAQARPDRASKCRRRRA